MKYRQDGMGDRRVDATALTLLAGAVLAALAVFYKRHEDTGNGKNRGKSLSGKSISDQKRNARINPRNPYAALSIVPGNNPCEAAQRVAGKKYLLIEAPKLPLSGCDPAHCQCRVTHHDDRRESNEDRRHPSAAALTTQLYEETGASNRRKRQRGRRKTDWA